jgi:hypothetical protein
MVKHLHAQFLANAREYKLAEAFWEELWGRVIGSIRPRDAWEHPWVSTEFADGTPFADGNPIFSSVAPARKQGIRIIQHEPTSDALELEYWVDWFGDEAWGDQVITELVIRCALSEEAAEKVEHLIQDWAIEGRVDTYSRIQAWVLAGDANTRSFCGERPSVSPLHVPCEEELVAA